MEKISKKKVSVKDKKEKQKKTTNRKDLTTKIYDFDGKEKEEIKLLPKIFNVKVSDRLIAQYVRVYLSNQKQGTQSTKTRSEVKGSTRKIYRQKGTGRARHGDIKAPIFVGGGIAHGPRPRDLSLKMNKKHKRKVLLGILSQRFKNGDVYFVDGLLKIKPKTQQIVKLLKNLKLDGHKSIMLIPPKEGSENLFLAARNIKNVEVERITSVNGYQLLKAYKLIFTEEALSDLNKFNF